MWLIVEYELESCKKRGEAHPQKNTFSALNNSFRDAGGLLPERRRDLFDEDITLCEITF